MPFEPQKHLGDAVADGDVSRIRQALQTCLNQDRGNATGLPEASLRWVIRKRHVGNLFQDHDDEETSITEERADWSADYWTTQKVALSYNFSEKRFDHLMDVGKYLCDEKGEEDYKPSPLRKKNAVPRRERPVEQSSQTQNSKLKEMPKRVIKRVK